MNMCPAQTDDHNDAARWVTARKAVGSGCEHVLFMTIHGRPVAHRCFTTAGNSSCVPPLLHPPSVPSSLAGQCPVVISRSFTYPTYSSCWHAALHHSCFNTVAVTISLIRKVPFSIPLPVLIQTRVFEVKPHVPCYKIRIIAWR
jgi:hypothetical protein